MCIIIYKPEKSQLPNYNVLETAFSNNPHGGGYMFRKGDIVVIKKGFMDFESFIREFEKDKPILEKTEVAIHFRIATTGSVTPENTHPFPISSDIKKLKRTYIECRYGVCHNGIIDIPLEYQSLEKEHDLSDTQIFIKTFLSKAKKNLPCLKPYIEELIGYSKMVIFTPTETLILNEKEGIWDNGIWYSNTSYSNFFIEGEIREEEKLINYLARDELIEIAVKASGLPEEFFKDLPEYALVRFIEEYKELKPFNIAPETVLQYIREEL